MHTPAQRGQHSGSCSVVKCSQHRSRSAWRNCLEPRQHCPPHAPPAACARWPHLPKPAGPPRKRPSTPNRDAPVAPVTLSTVAERSVSASAAARQGSPTAARHAARRCHQGSSGKRPPLSRASQRWRVCRFERTKKMGGIERARYTAGARGSGTGCRVLAGVTAQCSQGWRMLVGNAASGCPPAITSPQGLCTACMLCCKRCAWGRRSSAPEPKPAHL